MSATLNEDLDKALSKAKMSTTLVTVLALFSVCAIGFWLNYAHNKFVAFTPEMAADSGVGYVQQELPGLEPKIKEQVIAAAPQLMKTAEDQLNAMPDKFADMMMTRTKDEMNKVTPQLEAELYKAMKSALDQAKAHRGAGVDDATHSKAVAQLLADTYGEESLKLIDEVKTKYAGQGTDVLAHLEHLADNKKLTRRESLERQALVTFLTIASRAKSTAAGM